MAYNSRYAKNERSPLWNTDPAFASFSDKELFEELKRSKDRSVRSELITRHMYIAEILSKKYANKGIEYEDIFQVASLGLILAIDRYDPDKGFEFSSFSTPTIIGEIKKYFRDKGWSIRVPRKVQELSKKVNQAKNDLQNTLERIPRVHDIANHLGISEEEVIEAMEASQVYRLKSLDLTYDNENDDKEVAFMDLLGDEDKTFTLIENHDFVKKVMEKLTAVERQIIEDRFFLQKTQMKIAEEMGISQMTVSRMEKRVLQKIKKEYDRSYL